MLRFAIAIFLASTVSAFAQDAMVRQNDWQALAKILNEDTPPKWAQPILKWANDTIQRDAAEKAKAAEAVKKPDTAAPEPKKP